MDLVSEINVYIIIIYMQGLTTQLKIVSCINLQLPIIILEKFNYSKHTSWYNVHVYQFSAKSG